MASRLAQTVKIAAVAILITACKPGLSSPSGNPIPSGPSSPAGSSSPSGLLKVGDERIEKSYADMNGDGVQDTILLRKTVTGTYPFASGEYDYDVIIEILNGKDGKSLFKSQSFHTEAIGVLVTEGKLNVRSAEKGPATLEYVETTIHTEGAGRIVDVKKYLFEWTGKEIGVKEMSSNQ